MLEYANRATSISEAVLDKGYLTKTVQLSLSGLTVALPSDYGLLINCYADTDSDGKPDFYYFKDGELLEGFKLCFQTSQNQLGMLSVSTLSEPA